LEIYVKYMLHWVVVNQNKSFNIKTTRGGSTRHNIFQRECYLYLQERGLFHFNVPVLNIYVLCRLSRYHFGLKHVANLCSD